MLIPSPPDGGSLYAETDLSRFFPEPFNFTTSLLFLALAVYWTFRLRQNPAGHRFLIFALILLYVGGIGGSVYHGLRRWPFFLVMDWLPILLLCVSAGMYFIVRLSRWYVAAAVLLGFIALQYLMRTAFAPADIQFFINLNYAMMAALVLLPVLWWLVRTQFRHGGWVLAALGTFAPALTFRIHDGSDWLPMGTHFLWHLFGAVAAYCMFRFIYEVDTIQTDTD